MCAYCNLVYRRSRILKELHSLRIGKWTIFTSVVTLHCHVQNAQHCNGSHYAMVNIRAFHNVCYWVFIAIQNNYQRIIKIAIFQAIKTITTMAAITRRHVCLYCCLRLAFIFRLRLNAFGCQACISLHNFIIHPECIKSQ